MSKFCIYWKTRVAGLTVDDKPITGCTILGMIHCCVKCPNLIEIGEKTYTFNKTIVTQRRNSNE